jgi:acyl-CoA thioester hydrolase
MTRGFVAPIASLASSRGGTLRLKSNTRSGRLPPFFPGGYVPGDLALCPLRLSPDLATRMPRIFVQRFTVGAEAIDVNGHVNNLAYLRWMQDGAIAHSAAQGWPLERYREAKAGWVVRSHFIEYLHPAFIGEMLSLLTWVTGFRKHSSPRKFLFWRERDGQVLVQAETLWVFVDATTGRPATIPPELSSAFEVVPPEENVRALLPRGEPRGAPPGREVAE